jgi:uncharacterized membrane protein YbjE (DUF340 family)
MTIIFAMLALGAVIGHRYKGNKYVIKYIHIVSFWSVLILLFLLGFAVGQNELITSNLHKIGLKSLVLSIGTVLGSSVMSMIVYRKYFRQEEKK